MGGARAIQTGGAAIAVDADDLGGTVTGPSGPEAGVWVIAETRDLPTPFAKIVVTDDRGRYLVPDLPKATYNVWVRGYGLVDSPKTQTAPGKTLDLKAVPASSPAAAAQYYPAAHWLALMEMPAKSEFPGTGDEGNGINPNMKNQGDWIRSVKSGGCTACHALGNKATREIPAALGPFHDTVAGWDRRVKSGQAGGGMYSALNNFGKGRVLKMFADWTDAVKAGAVPPAPKRPQGIERNVVITQWDWADPKAYLHDVASTDRRNPKINANGPVYGALELSADYTPVLDPRTHTASRVPLTVRDPGHAADQSGDARVVAVLGRRGDLDQQEQRPQPDARRQGPRVAHLGGPAVGESAGVQGRLDASVGEAVPGGQRRPSPADVRPGDQEADPHRHLLRHPPPDVR